MMCDCPDGPTAVTDWACGDVVCSSCGVVVESHILDESPEWNDYSRSDGGVHDSQCRVGQAVAVADERRHHLGTFLAPPQKHPGGGGGGVSKRLCRLGLASRRDPKAAALHEGLVVLDSFLSGMRLSSTSLVANRAKELLADLHDVKAIRGDNRDAAAAAALYYGCKMENAARELRLVSQVCQVDIKALNAATSEYKASLAHKAYYPRLFATLQAGKLIDIFLDRLRLAPDVRKRVWRTAHQLDESLVDLMDCGRKPRTICSGLLYIAAQRERVAGVGKKEITEACHVCQQTLDKVVAQILSSSDPTTSSLT